MTARRHVLLVAHPVDRDSFVERFRAQEVGDCVRVWSRQFAAADPQQLWPSYEPVAKRMLAIARESAKLGVEVIFNAELRHLQAALQDDVTLALAAHWKGAGVFDFDVRSAQAILDSLGRDATTDHLLLRQLLGPANVALLQATPNAQATVRLASALTSLIENEDIDLLDNAFDDDPVEAHQARNRQYIDALFPDALLPGNRLELWDRMVDEASFVAAVPRKRQAAIDLAVCNSAIVGRRLQFQCDCPVLTNRRTTGILFRLELFLQVVTHAARTGASYVESALMLRDDYIATTRGSA